MSPASFHSSLACIVVVVVSDLSEISLAAAELNLTELFAVLVPQYPPINIVLWVVQKCRMADFRALKL